MYERISLFLGRTLMTRLSDLKREEGQGIVEYGLVIAFVALFLGAVLYLLAPAISVFITKVGDDLSNIPAAI